MTNDKLLSQTISYMRFPLAVGVVFIHFNLSEGLPTNLNFPDWYFYLIQFFSNVLPCIAVPLFFLISGFLFFYNIEFNRNIYKQKLYSRTKTLLIPYLLWNTITLLLSAARVIPFVSSLTVYVKKAEFHFTLVRLFNTFFNYNNSNSILVIHIEDTMGEISNLTYPINLPMWYVRDLMVMVLLAPAIYWMVKKMGKWTIISIGLIKYCVIPILLPQGGYPSQFIIALFFFSWGAYFSINQQNFVDKMRKYKYIPLIYFPIAIIDTLTKHTGYNFYFHNLGVLLGIASAIIIASYLIEKKKVKVNPMLANASFFIYALHFIFLKQLGRAILIAFHLPKTTFVMLTLYFVVPIITIILCLIIYIMLRKYAPNVWMLLTGGR